MYDVPPNLEDDPVRELANTILYLDKADAARRHIEAAVKCWHEGDFDLAITLAGAADGMTKGVKEDTLYKELMKLRPSGLDEARARNNLNASRNWLKHDTPYLPNARPFTVIEGGIHIILAANKWGLDEDPPVNALASLWDFMIKFMIENGDMQHLVDRLTALENK